MLQADKDKLRELLVNYSPIEITAGIVSVALDLAGELSDEGINDKAKCLSMLAITLEDLVLGKIIA